MGKEKHAAEAGILSWNQGNTALDHDWLRRHISHWPEKWEAREPVGKIGSELNLEGQGSWQADAGWEKKSRRKETPGKHSEAGWCGGWCGMYAERLGWWYHAEEGAQLRGRLQKDLKLLTNELNFIFKKGNR